VETTLLCLGVGSLAVAVTAAQFVKNPPSGYAPGAPAKTKKSAGKSAPSVDFSFMEMLKTKRFFLMFVIYLLAASVGQMFISRMKLLAETQVKIDDATLIVSFLAIMNSAGRVLGGLMSDKIGRVKALYVVLVLQMLNLAVFRFYTNLPLLLVGITAVGFCFGTLLSVFPAMTADQYGLKNFGINYGILFLAWGVSGVIAPVIADYFYGINGNFYNAYIICAIMMAAMVFVNWLLQRDIAKRPNF